MNIKKLPRVMVIIATITCLVGSTLTVFATEPTGPTESEIAQQNQFEEDENMIQVNNYSGKPAHATLIIMTDFNDMRTGFFDYSFTNGNNYYNFHELWDGLNLFYSDGSKYAFYNAPFGIDPGTYAFSTNSDKKLVILTPDLKDPGYGTYDVTKPNSLKQYETTVNEGENVTLYAIYGDEAFIKHNMSELIKYAKEKSGLTPKEEKEAEVVGTQVINATEKVKSPNFKRIIIIIVASITIIVLLVLWIKRRNEKRRIWKEYQEELDRKNKEKESDD